MWFRQFTKYATKNDHKVWCYPHSTEHDTQPIAYLFSKQAVPYRTRGDTCCHGVSTPKIQCLADLSMTNHFTWWNPTISTIPTLLKPQHRPSPWSIHILMDGRQSLTKTLAKPNIIKDGKTCMTLMTAWLSITNQVWTHIIKYEAWVQYESMHASVYTRERKHIGSTWSRVTWLASHLLLIKIFSS
jgi:hypothetical protein